MADESNCQIPKNSASTFRPIRISKSSSHILTPCRKILQKWLGHVVRVVLDNGLILVGVFSFADPDSNLVLSKCGTFLADGQEPISVGSVMVPGNKISTFAVDMAGEKVEQSEKEEET